eukprot:3388437-Pyramimonas_sp.AAC.2
MWLCAGQERCVTGNNGKPPISKGTLGPAISHQKFFRIENVVSVILAKSIHKLHSATYAESCTLVHYDIDVNPGFHYYEAE